MLKRWLEKVQAQKAFSLVELMVVVAIIGILAAIGVPQYQVFQAKARQSEAKENLGFMYTLEQAYFGDNNVYTATSATVAAGSCGTETNLGFKPANCAGGKTKYAYSATGGASFTGTAAAANKVINPTVDKPDTWTITQDGGLDNTTNGTR